MLTASTALLLVTTFALRERISIVASTTLWAVAGLGLGVGGVLMIEDPEPSAWLVAPLMLSVGAAAHMRALWAGEGPLRT